MTSSQALSYSTNIRHRMNWLEPPQEPPDDAAAVEEATKSTDDGPEMSTLNYWAHRLNPLHDPSPGYSASAGPTGQSTGKEVVFVACNRVGTESGMSGSLPHMSYWH